LAASTRTYLGLTSIDGKIYAHGGMLIGMDYRIQYCNI
jgi:hypothetical protein